jgi:hypothetical protein
MRVAVIGGTGRLGRETVSELINAGIDVKCLVRPTTQIPDEWSSSLSSSAGIEVVRGSMVGNNDETRQALTRLVDGCTHCLALYGATRRSKISDILNSKVEDTDLTHAKQINYESIKCLVEVCEESSTCKDIIRITGKGENPTSFFSVLINMLGSMAKGWNYEGECVLRASSDIGYTIIRPGMMKPTVDLDGTPEDGKKAQPQHLELADNGGNELKVSAVSYNQIAQLIVGCCTAPSPPPGSPRRRVTLSAMNVPGKATTTLQDQIKALKQDSRSFPTSLIAEHKEAVARVVRILAAVTVGFVAVIVGTVIKMISS